MTVEKFIEACEQFKNECGGSGPILGFTIPGEVCSYTYDFDDEQKAVADALVERFCEILNSKTVAS